MNKAELNNFLKTRTLNHNKWLGEMIDSDTPVNTSKFPYYPNEKGVGKLMSRDVKPQMPNTVSLPEQTDAQKPIYIIAMPHVPSKTSAKSLERWNQIVEQYNSQSFGTTSQDSQKRVGKQLVLIAGMNRMRSLDQANNRQFDEAINQIPPTPFFATRVFGTQWVPEWHKRKDLTSEYRLHSPEKSYLHLKLLRPEAAIAVLEAIEGKAALPKNLKDQIPYQTIRQWIKDHPSSRAVVATLQRNNNPLYWATMDDDCKALRIKDGLFSVYDRLIRDHNARNQEFPDLLSTGYYASEDALPILQLGFKIDMLVREAMNRVIPLSPYFPEPNLLLRITHLFDTCFYTFKKGKSLEGRRLIQNGLASGAIRKEHVIFSAVEALITDEKRMIEETHKGKQVSPISKLGQKGTLKALRGIPQSHLFTKNWVDNLYLALPIKRKQVTDVTQELSKLLNLYDPIELSYGYGAHAQNKYTYKAFKTILEAYSVLRINLKNALNGVEPKSFYPFKDLTIQERKNVHQYLLTLVRSAKNAKAKLKEYGLSDEWIQKVDLAASESGQAIWTGLEQGV